MIVRPKGDKSFVDTIHVWGLSLVSEEAAAKLQPFAELSQDQSLVNRDLEKVC